jgi:hypothetical protein
MSWRLPGSSMLFDCACFVTERLRSDLAKATIRATAWLTMASRVWRGDLRNIAEPSQRMAIARFARTISAIAQMRAGFLCVRLAKEPEIIWLHSFAQVGLAIMHTLLFLL